MKEREPLNLASASRAPPVGRPGPFWVGGIFNRHYGEISTGVDRKEVDPDALLFRTSAYMTSACSSRRLVFRPMAAR